MALVDVALLVRQHPGHQTADGVRHRHGGDLAPGQHEVAQGDFLVHTLLNKALVHALVVAADQHQVVVVLLQPPCGRLGVGLALGGEVDDPAAALARVGYHRVQAGFQGLGHHHAAEAPAVGVVVHLLLFVFGVVPDLHAVDLHQALPGRPADDALVKHRVDGVRKQR